jgi:hypothetical protein
VCVNFFYGCYGGSPPLAKAFPEDFQTSVPENVVLVAMVAVSDCIAPFTVLIILDRYTSALTTIVMVLRISQN